MNTYYGLVSLSYEADQGPYSLTLIHSITPIPSVTAIAIGSSVTVLSAVKGTGHDFACQGNPLIVFRSYKVIHIFQNK